MKNIKMKYIIINFILILLIYSFIPSYGAGAQDSNPSSSSSSGNGGGIPSGTSQQGGSSGSSSTSNNSDKTKDIMSITNWSDVPDAAWYTTTEPEEVLHLAELLKNAKPGEFDSYAKLIDLNNKLELFYGQEGGDDIIGSLLQLDRSGKASEEVEQYIKDLYVYEEGSLSYEIYEAAKDWNGGNNGKIINGGENGLSAEEAHNAMEEIMLHRIEGTVKDNTFKNSSGESNYRDIKYGSEEIYKQPIREDSDTETGEESVDDMIKDADSFINIGHSNYNETVLQDFSKTMYNILLAVGVVAAVIVGAIIGLKLMMETSPEEKAETTKLLVPYIAGCVIVFGGFTIWKIVVIVLQGM